MFPLHNFSFFIKNQVFIGLWINIRVFVSIPSVILSGFMLVPSCFYYYSPIVEIDVRDGDAWRSSFIVQDYFGYPEVFFSHVKLSIVLSRPVKICDGILMGTALKLYIAFGKIAIFIMLILPIQEEIFPFSGIFFSFFLQSLKALIE